MHDLGILWIKQMRAFFLLFFLVKAVFLLGCGCSLPSIATAFKRSDLVFYGKHLETRYTGDYFLMGGRPQKIENFEVRYLYKGGIPNQTGEKYTISILSPCDGGSCEFCFEAGKYYLIYGYINLDIASIVVNSCYRTREIIGQRFQPDEYDKEHHKDEHKELLRLSADNKVVRDFAGSSTFEMKNEKIAELEQQLRHLEDQRHFYKVLSYTLSIMLIGVLIWVISRRPTP